jgi:chromosome segregation ATPase
MGFLDSLKAWLRTEQADLAESTAELERRLDEDLTRRERQLDESPTEAMERLQAEITDNDTSIDAIRDQLDSPGDED